MSFLSSPAIVLGNTITKEGSTDTSVQVDGNVTDITTSTVKGNSGFNSFGRFEVASGNTVNLHLPSGTDNLVNLVHNAQAQINGTLNGMKGGRIGGNIIFADPHGFVVGAAGIVNVGSLVVTTPTPDEMSRILDNLDDAGVSGIEMDEHIGLLMRGELDQAADAEILIQGQINAKGAISLIGASVVVANGARLEGGADDAALDVFKASVNVEGMATGDDIQARDGVISIVSSETTEVSGELVALMEDDSGVSVSVDSQGATNIAGTIETKGGDAHVRSNSSVTLHEGGHIDTRVDDNVEAGAGDVEIAVNDKKAATDNLAWDPVTTNAEVNLNGQINAANVNVMAAAESSVGLTTDYLEQLADGNFDLTIGEVNTPLSELPLELAYMEARANASIQVGGTAQINATGDVTLDSWSSQTTKNQSYNLGASKWASLDLIAGKVSGGSVAEIGDGARLTAENINVDARQQSELSVNSMIHSTNESARIAASIGLADIENRAEVASGTTLNLQSGNLAVNALARNSLSVKATTMAGQAGKAGIAAGLLFPDISTRALLGGSVTGAENVVVNADSFLDTMAARATSTTGSGVVLKTLHKVTGNRYDMFTKAIGSINTYAKSGFYGTNGIADKNTTAPSGGSTSTPKLASAVAFTLSKVETEAGVSDGASITATGNTSVTARTHYQSTPDASEKVAGIGLHNTAASGVESTAKGEATQENPTATYSLSAAIAAGWYENSARAWVGKEAEINTGTLKVDANVHVPMAMTWWNLGKWDEFSAVTDNLLNLSQKANMNVGLLGPQLFTSYASATGSAENLNIAGAVNYFAQRNDAQAWIDEGAKIATENSDPDGSLSIARASELTREITGSRQLELADSLDVQAQGHVHSLNGAGNINALLTGTTSNNASVGLGFSFTDFSTHTEAWIAPGAAVTSASGAAIKSYNNDLIINLTPSSGAGKMGSSGGPFAVNGTFALTRLDNRTHASISNRAALTLDGGLNLNADQDLIVWSTAGAVSNSTAGGVGVGLALNWIDTNTQAYIGDNTGQLDDNGTGTSACGADGQPECRIVAASADVSAKTDGRLMSLGVAGTTSGGKKSGTDDGGGIKDKLKSSVTKATDTLQNRLQTLKNQGQASDGSTLSSSGKLLSSFSATEKLSSLVGNLGSMPTGDSGTDDAAYKVRDQVEGDFKDSDNLAGDVKGEGTASQTQQAKFGFNLSGSAAGNVSLGETSAYVDDSSVELIGGLDISGTRRTITFAGGGAAAWRRETAEDAEFEAGAAGALGLNVLADRVDARLTDSVVTQTNAADVNIEAARGGLSGAVGTGTTIAQGADVTVTPSVSMTIGLNETRALIDNTELTSAGADLNVNAYDHNNIATGGGSLYKGGSRAGIGGAVSFNLLANQTHAEVIDGSYEGLNNLNVSAASPARVLGGAGVAGLGSQDQQANFAGAFVINNIANTTSARVQSTVDAPLDVSLAGDLSVTSGDAENQALATRLGDLGSADGDTLWNLTEGFDITGAQLPDFSTVSVGDADLQNEEYLDGLAREPNFLSPTTGKSLGGSIIGAAGLLQQNSAKMSAGATVVYNGIYSKQAAELENVEVSTPGDVTVRADNGARIMALSAGLGVQGGSGSFSGMASTAVNVIANQTRATVDEAVVSDGAQGATNALNVNAEDGREIFSGAGNLVVSSSKTTLAAGAGINVIESSVAAEVLSSDINTRSLNVTSDSATGVASLAASAGSLNLNLDLGSTYSRIVGSRLIVEDGELNLLATDRSSLWGAAGAAAFGKEGGSLGLAASVNVTRHDTAAELLDSDMQTTGSDVSVEALRQGFAVSAAAAGAGTSGVAGGISAAVNVIGSDVEAWVSGISGGSNSAAVVNSLEVRAQDSADAWSLGGAAGVSSGSIGAGGAVTLGWSDASVRSRVIDSQLDINDRLDVSAQSSGLVSSLGVAAAGGSGLALGGVLSANAINNHVEAGISRTSQENLATVIDVDARDTSAIWSVGVGGSVASTASGGIVASGNGIGTDVLAYVEGDGTASASVLKGHDLKVNAESDTDINSLVVSGAAAGTFAAAGSLVVNALDGSTIADIRNGADVRMLDDLLITALGSQQVRAFAGAGAFSLGFGAAGIAGAVNVLLDEVKAQVRGDNTRVLALGRDNDDGQQVASGALEQNFAADSALENVARDESAGEEDRSFEAQQEALADQLSNFRPEKSMKTVNGLAVNAMSVQQAHTAGGTVSASLDPTAILKLIGGVLGSAPTGGASLVATFLGSGSGVAINAAVNVLGGQTLASIDNVGVNETSLINEQGESLTAGDGQSLNLNAASHQTVGSLAFAGSLGSAAGTAGATSVTVADRETRASLANTDVEVEGDINVDARASEAVGSMAAGFGGALLGLGLGGSAVVNVLDSKVIAETYGATLHSENLAVLARHEANVGSSVGVLSGGALAAAAVPVATTVSSGTTEALLGAAGANTTTEVNDTISLDAVSVVQQSDIVAGMAASGSVGGAGAVSVRVLEDVTRARMLNTNMSWWSDVEIDAISRINIGSYVGSAGLGVAAAGGMSVNTNILRTTTQAEILDSEVKTNGLRLNADVVRSMDLMTLGLAGSSGGGAIAGSVGMALIGGVDTGSSQSGMKTAWDSTSSLRNSAIELADESREKADRGTETTATETRADTVGATIKGGITRATNNAVVDIDARESTDVTNLSGGVGIGTTYLGAGGGLAYTRSAAEVKAQIDQDSFEARSLFMDTRSTGVREAEAFAGSAGPVALGAAVADSQSANTLTSSVSGDIVVDRTLSMSTRDDSDIRALGYGANAGVGAAGVVTAFAERDSTVTTEVADNSVVGEDKNPGNLQLNASTTGDVSSEAWGATAGIVATGNAAVAESRDQASVHASIGDNVELIAADADINAFTHGLNEARAMGASASLGASLGASVARAISQQDVSASTGDNVQLDSGNDLSVTAERRSLTDEGDVRARAWGGTGGLLLGVDASVAEVKQASTVTAETGTGLSMKGGSNLNMLAANSASGLSDASSITIGGIAAAGTAISHIDDTTTTKALLGANATLGHWESGTASLGVGAVDIAATSSPLNRAHAMAGSGGVVAGHVVNTNTLTNNTVKAAIGEGSRILAQKVNVSSEYNPGYGSFAESVGAGALQASGAISEDQVRGQNEAVIGANAEILTLEHQHYTAAVDITSDHGDDNHQGTSVLAGAGGVASGNAAQHSTSITLDNDVRVGGNATLRTGIASSNPASAYLALDAYTVTDILDNLTLATGGAIAVSRVANKFDAMFRNDVTVKSDASLESNGDFSASTYLSAAVEADASGRLSGGVGSSDAYTSVSLTDDQSIDIQSGASIFGNRHIRLTAGSNRQGVEYNSAYLKSTANSYTSGVLTLGDADADVTRTVNQAVTVQDSASINAARDVRMGGYAGFDGLISNGFSEAKQLGFIPIKGGNDTRTNTASADITVNGDVVAGRFNTLDLRIAESGDITINGMALNEVTSRDVAIPLIQQLRINPREKVENDIDDQELLDLLVQYVADREVAAIKLDGLFAAGGNVTINADSIQGDGKIEARGNPKIHVTNDSDQYLVLGTSLIPADLGGEVHYTGATSAHGGVNVQTAGADNSSEIRIQNTYNQRLGDDKTGPSLFQVGDVINPGGLVNMTVANGAYIQVGSIRGQQVLIEVPNGPFISYSPDRYWSPGQGPREIWASAYELTEDVGEAVMYVVNAEYDFNPDYNNGDRIVQNNLPLLFQDPDDGDLDGQTMVVFGGCRPASPNGDALCTEDKAGEFGTGWYTSGFKGVEIGSIPLIPYLSLSTSIEDFGDIEHPRVSGINAGEAVGIVAKEIDLNGIIESGRELYHWMEFNGDGALESWLERKRAEEGGQGVVEIPQIATWTAEVVREEERSYWQEQPEAFKAAYIRGISSLSSFVDQDGLLLKVAPEIGLDDLNIDENGLADFITSYYGGGMVDVPRHIFDSTGMQSDLKLEYSAHDHTLYVSRYEDEYFVERAQEPWESLLDWNKFLEWEESASGTGTGLTGLPDTYTHTWTETEHRRANLWSGYTQDNTPRVDLATGTIHLEEINATGGGYVYLRGDILNTYKSASKINVNTGFGQVDINNKSSLDLVVDRIDTGRGSEGVVKIADTLRDRTTWFRYNTDEGLTRLVADGVNTDIVDAGNAVSLSGRSTDYQPLEGLRYSWTETAHFQREFEPANSSEYVTDWRWVGGDKPDYSFSKTIEVDKSKGDTAFVQEIVGDFRDFDYSTIHYNGCGDSRGSDCNFDFNASYYDNGESEWEALWRYKFPVTGSIQYRSSVKADYPVGINFRGALEGDITVKSGGNLQLQGDVLNQTGAVTLESGEAIDNPRDGVIRADSLKMIAKNGGIGASDKAVQLGLGRNGALHVEATDTVNLSLDGGARLNLLDASPEGDVLVRAAGSLEGGHRSTDVRGRNIDLRVDSGRIGHLGIEAHEDVLADGRVLGGRVNLQATDGISITERAGDLWVEKIDAGLGDVSVTVTNGGLQDANQRTAQSTLSEEQIQAVWSRLKLTDGYGAENFVRNNTIPAFEHGVEQNYHQYWQLLSMGNVSNGQFQLKADSLERYRMMAKARGETDLTDEVLASAAAERYQVITGQLEDTLGGGWASDQAFNQYNPGFQYSASQSQIDRLMREAVWTEAELRHAVSEAALEPAGSAPVGRTDPTIQGNHLDLDIAREVGHLDEPVTIDYQSLLNGNITDNQAGALALAFAPGDVSILRDEQGNPEALNVLQTAPLFTQSTGIVRINAGDDLFVQANDTLEYSTIHAGGSARLAAQDSILQQAGADHGIQTNGDLSLVAGDGDLGRPADQIPLNLDVGGSLLGSSAGGGIALNWMSGDFEIGRVFAENDVYLQASSGALYSNLADGTHVTGDNITLRAHGNLGLSGQALNFEVQGNDGTLNARSDNGRAWLSTESDVAVDSVYALQGLELAVGGRLDLGELTTPNGELRLQVAGLIGADTGAGVHIDAPNTTKDSFIEAGGSMGDADAALKANLGALSELVSLGGGVHLDLASALSTDTLSAYAGPVMITGNQNLSVGTLSVGIHSLGTTQAAGQSGYFEALVAGLTMGAADIAGYADVESSGSISLGDSTVGDHVQLVADGSLAFTELAAGDNASLQASGDITGAGITADNLTINAGGSIASAASLLRYTFNEGAGELTGSAKAGGAWLQSASTTQLNSFTTGGDFRLQLTGTDNPSLDIKNHVTAGEGLHIEAAGDIALNRIETGSGIFQLLSGGAIQGYDSSEAHIMAAASVSGSRIRAASDIGESDVPLRVSLGQMDAVESDHGSIWLHQLDGWSVGRLMATNGDTRIAGDGRLEAENVNTGHFDVRVDEIDIGQATAYGDAYLESSEGDLAIRGLRASGKADLESAATVSFGHPEQDDVPLTPADLEIGTALNVRAEEDIRGGNATSGDTMELVAGQELIFGQLESLGLDLLLEAGTDITGARAIAARDLGIVAGGRLKVDDTQYGGSLSLRAGRDLTIGTGEDIVLTGAIEAGRDITVTSGEAINMESLRAGRDVYLEADGDINIEKFLSAGADVDSEYDIYDTGNLTLLSTGNVVVGEDVLANGTMDIQVDGDLRVAGEMTALDRINAATGENLKVAGGIQSRASSVWLDTGASLVTPELLAGAWMDVTTGGSELALDRALANEEVNIRVGTADGRNYASDGSLAINELAGDWIQLDSGNSVSIDQARSRSALEIASAYINIGQLDHTGTGSLDFNAKGRVAEPAEQLTAIINADAVESELYRVRDTRLAVSGEQVRFDQAEYIDRFDMQTPSAHLLADNVNPVYAGVNVQLREQDKAFWFDQTNTVTQTNAFVLHRDHTHQVMVPNYMEDHESEGGVMYGGSSAARYADRTQQWMNAPVDLPLAARSRMPMPGYDLAAFLEFGLSVNLRDWETMMENGVMVGSTGVDGADNEI
ncbi:leukotoxin LktA family filamentous adhesin [Marinobacter persicus]|uniref:leukotoxin LktA family filamentous adhesin n=1 Tax=Marinobacter persicus TaxID=930118 RepID=UPI0015E406EF|nr:leukotoxin LktA family filamentous adhesin [Marinobacter persicus]